MKTRQQYYFILFFTTLAGFLLCSCEHEVYSDRDNELPQINVTSIIPKVFKANDTILLQGRGFDALYPSRNSVGFQCLATNDNADFFEDGRASKALENQNSDKQIAVVVPDYVLNRDIIVYVGKKKHKVPHNLFTVDTTLLPPQIESISPEKGFIGDTVIIKGEFFLKGLYHRDKSEELRIKEIHFGALKTTEFSYKKEINAIITKIPKNKSLEKKMIEVKLITESGTSSVNTVPLFVEKKPVVRPPIYWSSYRKGINVNTEAQGLKQIYPEGENADKIDNITIDAQKNTIYWMNREPAEIRIIKGAMDGKTPAKVIFSGITKIVMDMVFDTKTNLIYFMENDFSGTFTIYSLSADGKTKETVGRISNYAIISSSGLAIDKVNKKFYCALIKTDDYMTSYVEIYEGSLSSSNTDLKMIYDKKLGVVKAVDMVIDTASGNLYLLNDANSRLFGLGKAKLSIVKVKIDGSSSIAEEVVPSSNENFDEVSDLKIDVANRYLYWLNDKKKEQGGGAISIPGTVKRFNLETQEIETVYTGILAGRFFDLDLSE